MRLAWLLSLVLVVPFGGRAAAQSAGSGSLQGSARLLAVYDEILNARFAHARELLSSACPPAPREACLALEGAILWWQVVLNPDDHALDARIQSVSATAIAAANAWTERDPKRAEAWFYLAGAYGPFVQLRVWRGERLAAARDGNRIRAALERALELDPTLLDAKFGIGLYHYYADVVPAPAKMLRWLLWLPGGNRQQGLREMQEARDHGQLLKGEADFQLHWLYLWYEHQPQRALELLADLDERYRANPVFLQRIAEVQSTYLHDHPASASSWQRLAERARGGLTSADVLALTRAQLGLAAERDAMFETDRAIEPLRAVIAAQPSVPFGAIAEAQVLLGEAFDRLGRRDDATPAYRAALGAAAVTPDVRTRAQTGLRRQPDTAAGESYRLSLEGLRQLERGDAAAALSSLTRARTLRPDDLVVAFRYARALMALGRRNDARPELERVLNARTTTPAVVESSACVAYAALLEQSGERTSAISYYERALTVSGGAISAREDAQAALKRLRS